MEVALIDPFASDRDALIASSRAPFAINPDDAAPLPVLPKAIFVGTGGTLVLRGVAATDDVTLRNVASGQILDIRASHVRATGTTAADLADWPDARLRLRQRPRRAAARWRRCRNAR